MAEVPRWMEMPEETCSKISMVRGWHIVKFVIMDKETVEVMDSRQDQVSFTEWMAKGDTEEMERSSCLELLSGEKSE